MSCKLRKGLTAPVDRSSLVTPQGEVSMVWEDLWDAFTDENGNTDIVQAYQSFLITESESFKKWFSVSKNNFNTANDQQGPLVFRDENGNNAHFRRIDPATKTIETWSIIDPSIETAINLAPIGLQKIPGISALQLKELSDMYFRELVKNEQYEVSDFTNLENISMQPVIDLAYYMAHPEGYAKDYAEQNGETPSAEIRKVHSTLLNDLVVQNENGELQLNPESILVGIISRKVGVGESVKTKMQQKEDIEELEGLDERSTKLNIEPAFFVNPKTKASLNIRLMIQTLDDVFYDENGNIEQRLNEFGQPILVNESKIYNRLLEYLSDSHTTAQMPDLYDVMIDKLNALAAYHPEFVELTQRLSESNQYKKTQFVKAFNRPRISYTSTFIEGDSRNEVRIGSPDVNSSSNNVLANWKESFETKVLKLNKEQQKVVNVKTVELAKKKYEKLNQVLNKEVAKWSRSGKQVPVNFKLIIKELKETLDTVGINMSTEALTYLVNETQEDKRSEQMIKMVRDLKVVFLSSTAKDARSIGNLKENQVLEDDAGDVLSIMEDERHIKALAIAESRYQSDLVDSMVLGPAGKGYWLYGQHSFLSKTMQQIKQGNLSHIEAIENLPYSKGSRWISWIKKNFKDFEFKQMLHMKNTEERTDGLAFKRITGIDEFINEFHRTMRGMYPTIAKGTSAAEYYIEGPELVELEELQDVMMNYIINDFNTKVHAHEQIFGENPINGHIKFFHYNGTSAVDETGYPTGNVFKSDTMMFPELGYDTELSKELGLYYTAGKLKGRPVADFASRLNNEKVTKLIQETFDRIVLQEIKFLVDNNLAFYNKDGVLANLRLESKTISKYKTEEDISGTATAVQTYVLNRLISARESLGLLVGHPAMYKSMEDMPKRTSHFTTPVEGLRIYKENGKYAVHPYYIHATIPEVEVPSTLSSDPNFVKQVGKEVAQIYSEANLTDATTWVSPTLYKQREIGLGNWSDAKNEAFDRIMKNKAEPADYELIQLTPKKGTVRGMVYKAGQMVPTIEKTAYVVIWPALTNTTEMFENLYQKMVEVEKQNPGMGVQVAVDSAIKTGEVNLPAEVRPHANWGLAQELPDKGFKPTIVGSQSKVIITSYIDPEADYNGFTGEQWLAQLNQVETDISDKGKIDFAREWGLDTTGERGIINRERFFTRLQEEFDDDDSVKDMIRVAYNANIPIDSIFHVRNKIESAITNGLTAKTVAYKALGGQFVQISSHNLGFSMEAYDNVKKNLTGRIRWMKKEARLKPARIVNNKVVPSQILVPYKFVQNIPGYESMTDEQLKAAIDPKSLEILGYRIPTQSLGSIEHLEIVGILPPEAGDTIVVYEDITTKTGSDFDIDKLFLLIPNLEMRDGKLSRVSSEGKSRAALENKRLELWEAMLSNPATYATYMFPTDTAFLKDDAYEIRKAQTINDPTVDENGKDIMSGLRFLSPRFQNELRRRFLQGGKMVGVAANNSVDHIISMHAKLSIVGDLGIGNVFKIGENNYTSLHDLNSQNRMQIMQVMSAYMNAFVDIEKDPYISHININTNTANVAFLLLRAGVDYQFVNRFMAQPILKELSKQMDALRTEAAPVKYTLKKALQNTEDSFPQSVISRVEIEDLEEDTKYYTQSGAEYTFAGIPNDESSKNRLEFKNQKGTVMTLSVNTPLYDRQINPSDVYEGRLEDVLNVEILDDLISQGVNMPGYFKYQKYILDQFKFLNKEGNKLQEQLIASKASVQGSGRNLEENNIIAESYEKVQQAGNFRNFINKFDGTALGAHHRNSVEFLNTQMTETFLSQSNFMRVGLNALLGAIGKPGTTDILFRQRMVGKMYAYVYSKHTGNLLLDDHYRNLFFSSPSNKSLAQKFRELKSKTPNDPLLSLLTSSVNFNKDGEFIKPSVIKRRGSKTLAPEVRDAARERWTEMLRDPKTKQFANELAVMAFYTSGFSRNLNSFFDLIPAQWYISSNFAKDMKDTIDYLHLHGSMNVYQMVDQIIRHEFDNPEFVTEVKKGKQVNRTRIQDSASKTGGYTFAEQDSITISGKAAKNLATVRKGKKILDYQRYIKVEKDVEGKVEYAGYNKKTGETQFKTVKGKEYNYYRLQGIQFVGKAKNLIYIKTTPLGYKGPKGVSINEFQYDTRTKGVFTTKESAFPDNGAMYTNPFIKKQLGKITQQGNVIETIEMTTLAEQSNPNQFKCT